MASTRFQPNVPNPGIVDDSRYKASFQRSMSWDKSTRVVTIDPKHHDLAAAVNQGEIDTKYILLPGVHGTGALWTLSKRCCILGTFGASIAAAQINLEADGIVCEGVDFKATAYSTKNFIRLTRCRWLPAYTGSYCAVLHGTRCIVENCWSEASAPGIVGVSLHGTYCVAYGNDFSAHATPILYVATDGHKLVCNLGMPLDQVNADLLDGNHAAAFALAGAAPAVHAPSHVTGTDQIGTFSAGNRGLVVAPAGGGGDATKFLRGDATWQTVSSGTSQPWKFNNPADQVPSVPNAMDDEFPGSSLDAKWTAYNLGTLPVAVEDGFLKLTLPQHPSFQANAWVQAMPSGDWTVQCCVRSEQFPANHMSMGLILMESDATGAADAIGSLSAATGAFYTLASRFTNLNAYGSDILLQLQYPAREWYFQIRKSGGTYYFAVSQHGEAWNELASDAPAWTATKVGVFCNQQWASAPDATVMFKWFRRVA